MVVRHGNNVYRTESSFPDSEAKESRGLVELGVILDEIRQVEANAVVQVPHVVSPNRIFPYGA